MGNSNSSKKPSDVDSRTLTFDQRFRSHLRRKRADGFWQSSTNFGILPFNVPVFLVVLGAIAVLAALIYLLKRKVENDRERQREWLHEISLNNPNGAPFPIIEELSEVEDMEEMEDLRRRMKLYKKIASSAQRKKNDLYEHYQDYNKLLGP